MRNMLGNGIRPGLRDTKEDSDTYGLLLVCVKTRSTGDNICTIGYKYLYYRKAGRRPCVAPSSWLLNLESSRSHTSGPVCEDAIREINLRREN